jgi:hypothetical protein
MVIDSELKVVEILATAALLFQSTLTGAAQYAWFGKNTDIIAVEGQTELGDQCTVEAVLLLPTSQHSGGNIFNEWMLEKEEKSLGASITSISAVAFPNDYLEATERKGLVSLGTWHHIAFVCNGSEQRLYLDGLRIQSAPALSPIGNAPGQAFLGYAPRDGSDFPSFVGFLDSIRVSKVARYSGLSFTPPAGDLTSDPDTLLLYNFNDAPDSTTVRDEGPLSRVGTLGKGYTGATAPRLISKLPAEVPMGLRVFPAVELEFSSSLNVQYQLQSSPDMAVWSDLPEFMAGDGSVIRKLISTQGSPRLFYRVVARP